METIVRISSEQFKFKDMINIFERFGSKGNSAIYKGESTFNYCRVLFEKNNEEELTRRPSRVKRPSLSKALKECSCSSAIIKLSTGGASIKSKCNKSLMPMVFNCSTYQKIIISKFCDS